MIFFTNNNKQKYVKLVYTFTFELAKILNKFCSEI